MRLKGWLLSGCLSAALVFVAIPARAITAVHECVAGAPTPASHTWDFHHEADSLFQGLQADMHQISDKADHAYGYAKEDALDWQSNGDDLTNIRAVVNDASSKLCRLETIRRVLSPWQRQVVDKIAATLPLMVNSTEDAILFSNHHPQRLWTPAYQAYVRNVSRDAAKVDQSVTHAVEYAKTLSRYHELRGDLGVKTSS